jgi:hypothetical protein
MYGIVPGVFVLVVSFFIFLIGLIFVINNRKKSWQTDLGIRRRPIRQMILVSECTGADACYNYQCYGTNYNRNTTANETDLPY